MSAKPAPEVTLQVTADLSLVLLVNAFTEQASLALGLGSAEALALTLASEEVFSHACRVAAPGCATRLAARGKGYRVEVELSFAARGFDLRALNLTSNVRADDEESLEEMGLVIASRLVDRLSVGDSRDGATLVLAKDRVYPPGEHVEPVTPRTRGPLSVRPAVSEEVKLVAGLARAAGSPEAVPESLAFPGKVVDQVAAGDSNVLVAASPGGHLAGAVLWRWASPRTVEFHGPFLFSAPPGPSDPPEGGPGRLLTEALVSAVARTRAVGLLTRNPTEALPRESFERLGTLDTRAGDAWVETPAYFRLLHEDPGSTAWAHRELEGFLGREYDRLVLPRDLRLTSDGGERLAPHSVLATEFRRGRSEAVLRPLRAGDDAAENLSAHVELLANEGLASVLFEMDVAAAWQARFTPGLLALGFRPRLLIPYGGQGDLVVFQRVGT